MKKLLIVLIGFATACSLQAASIVWKSGTAVKAPTADGSFGTANAASGTLSMYVFIVDAATYSSLDVDKVVDTYSSQLSSATEKKESFGGAAGGQVSTTHNDWSTDAETTYYAAILLKYSSGGTEMFIGNKATGAVNTSGTGSTVNNLAKFIGGGTSGTAITGWSNTGSVPEPTSGLLLLLGVAGLALKRKRA